MLRRSRSPVFVRSPGSAALVGFVLLASPGLLSCSEEEGPTNERSGDIRGADVWKNGYKLTGVIRIVEGATVEIEPGARITCSSAVQILIGGTLRAKSGSGKRAAINCSSWRGILVGKNGNLELEGIDLENPEIGIETTRNAGDVSVKDSDIRGAARPFTVGAESTLTLTKVRATTPTTLPAGFVSVSEVHGKLVAKYLDYNANDNEGVMVMRGGEAVIEDSTMKATNGLDLVSSYGGKSLAIRYTTLAGAHCGPHIADSKDPDKVPTGSIEIDHVSSENNIYGITIYAASAEGPHVIKDSNFQGNLAWIDLQGDHGPITFQNVFTAGNETILNTDIPVFQKTTARIENAKPR
jgi:hypothetical protein